jgi:hypothetical protein
MIITHGTRNDFFRLGRRSDLIFLEIGFLFHGQRARQYGVHWFFFYFYYSYFLPFLFLSLFCFPYNRKISRSFTCEGNQDFWGFFFLFLYGWCGRFIFLGRSVIGVLHKACIFGGLFFVLFKPILHLLGYYSGDGDYYGSVPFLLRTWRRE